MGTHEPRLNNRRLQGASDSFDVGQANLGAELANGIDRLSSGTAYKILYDSEELDGFDSRWGNRRYGSTRPSRRRLIPNQWRRRHESPSASRDANDAPGSFIFSFFGGCGCCMEHYVHRHRIVGVMAPSFQSCLPMNLKLGTTLARRHNNRGASGILPLQKT